MVVILIAVVVVVVVGVLCWLTPRRPEAYAWVSECGADSVRVVVTAPGVSPPFTYTQLPISGPITDIPEFNDCQRFIKNDQYDSSYAIFVAYYLDAAWRLLQKPVVDSAPPYIARMGTNEVAVPVATVYSYGGTYPALGIEPGFNCLFLHRDTAAGSPIIPRMVPWGATDPDCGALTPLSQGPDQRLNAGKDLELKQPLVDTKTFAATFTKGDYPPVGRWDYDSTHDEHYVDLSCNGAMCEIGDPGFASSSPIALPTQFSTSSVSPSVQTRVAAIRGWYDQQRLASYTGSATQPSSTRGEFVPDPSLDQMNKNSVSYDNTWRRVAVASVDNDYKFFKQGSNTIELCHGTATECTIPTAGQSCSPNPTQDNWWARISPPTGDPMYKCVKRMDHGPAIVYFNATHPQAHISIPGTVRWRWRENDETTWMSCEIGCCTVIQ